MIAWWFKNCASNCQLSAYGGRLIDTELNHDRILMTLTISMIMGKAVHQQMKLWYFFPYIYTKDMGEICTVIKEIMNWKTQPMDSLSISRRNGPYPTWRQHCAEQSAWYPALEQDSHPRSQCETAGSKWHEKVAEQLILMDSCTCHPGDGKWRIIS